MTGKKLWTTEYQFYEKTWEKRGRFTWGRHRCSVTVWSKPYPQNGTCPSTCLKAMWTALQGNESKVSWNLRCIVYVKYYQYCLPARGLSRTVYIIVTTSIAQGIETADCTKLVFNQGRTKQVRAQMPFLKTYLRASIRHLQSALIYKELNIMKHCLKNRTQPSGSSDEKQINLAVFIWVSKSD